MGTKTFTLLDAAKLLRYEATTAKNVAKAYVDKEPAYFEFYRDKQLALEYSAKVLEDYNDIEEGRDSGSPSQIERV